MEHDMTGDQLSFNTRKSLCNHLGELAGAELATFLQQLKDRVETMERSKVDVTKIVPDANSTTSECKAAKGFR